MGQAYLLLIFVILYHAGFTYSWVGSPYEHWGPNGPQKTGKVSNFGNGSRVKKTQSKISKNTLWRVNFFKKGQIGSKMMYR